jgi:plasmid stabilization system protein ParE
MKIEWSAAALTDLDRFAEFLQDRYPPLSSIVAREIIAKARVLSDHPLLGRAIAGREEYRQVVLRSSTRPMSFNTVCSTVAL